jgi:flagellar basal body-associated protein FliL
MVNDRAKLMRKDVGFLKGVDRKSSEKDPGRTTKKKKRIRWAALSVLFLAGWMGWSMDSGLNPANGWAREKKMVRRNTNGGDVGPMVKLKPLIVNLRDEGGTRYVKTRIVLEITQEEYLQEVETLTPPILDLIISILCDKNLADLRTPQFKEGLKKELMEKSHQMLGSQKIKNIYFDEFIFQ